MLRRLLLDLKRACFNGRPVQTLTRREEWRDLPPPLASRAETLLEHEQSLASATAELRRIYEAETARSRAGHSRYFHAMFQWCGSMPRIAVGSLR